MCLDVQAKEAVRTQSQPGSLIIELSLDSVWVASDGQIRSSRSSPSLPSAYFSTGLPLPVYREFFPNLPENPRVRVFHGRARSFSLKSSPTVVREQGKGAPLEGPQAPLPPRTSQLFSVDPSSVYPGSVVTLYPLHQVGNSVVVWMPHLSLVITWPPSPGPTIQPLSKTRVTALSKPVNNRSDFSGPPVPDYQYSSNLVRISVDHEGWYAITYADLIDNNVVISGIDPRTFRLWDRDRECSLIVPGESDGNFSPDDRIIFWGQPAPPPEGVTYRSNFYSQEHWYWLTWGSGAGQRYVEESSYPEAPLDEVYHPNSFTDTLHVESNDYFARLGSRDLHAEWDQFDHFFMDPPIQGGRSVDFNLKIDYPTPSTEKRFSLKAEFRASPAMFINYR
ncbi:MAG: hypothetical protein GXO90_05650 [FCB group bacterium]|nr:hypothetical protein [FCB group bacterium]